MFRDRRTRRARSFSLCALRCARRQLRDGESRTHLSASSDGLRDRAHRGVGPRRAWMDDHRESERSYRVRGHRPIEPGCGRQRAGEGLPDGRRSDLIRQPTRRSNRRLLAGRDVDHRTRRHVQRLAAQVRELTLMPGGPSATSAPRHPRRSAATESISRFATVALGWAQHEPRRRAAATRSHRRPQSRPLGLAARLHRRWGWQEPETAAGPRPVASPQGGPSGRCRDPQCRIQDPVLPGAPDRAFIGRRPRSQQRTGRSPPRGRRTTQHLG